MTQPRVPQNEGECHTTFLTLYLEPEIFAVSSLKTLSTPAISPRHARTPGRSWGVPGRTPRGWLGPSYQRFQLAWGPVASVRWEKDVKLVVESCLCGWAMVLFALFKSPNLVKLWSFEISIYSCTVEACLTSKFFVVKGVSFILRGSYAVGELKRHRPILRESRYRAAMACESSGVWGCRRGERGKAHCSPLPRFLRPGNVENPM